MEQLTDHTLVQRILSGDLGSYKLLVQQHERLVFHMVRKILGPNNDSAEDVCQDIFMLIFKHLKDFKGDSKLSTWIGSIAYREALKHCTKRELNTTEEGFAKRQKDAKLNPEEALIQQDEHQLLRSLIDQLPVQYKTCLLLFHFEELSLAEITAITNQPEGTVKNYIFRGRKLLKDALSKAQSVKKNHHERII